MLSPSKLFKTLLSPEIKKKIGSKKNVPSGEVNWVL